MVSEDLYHKTRGMREWPRAHLQLAQIKSGEGDDGAVTPTSAHQRRRAHHARLTSSHSSASERSCSNRSRNAKIFVAEALSTARSAQEKNFSSTCSWVSGT